MSCILKRPGSKYFIACWTDANGRRLKRSTKTTERKVADKLARKFEEESRAKRTARQARQVLADIYKGLSGEELPVTTVREHFTGFTERKRPEVSRPTYEYYVGHARRFLAWLGAKADKDIAAIGKGDVTAYRNHVATSAGPRTTNNTLKAVKTFFAAAMKDGYLTEDPAADVETVRDRSESTRRPFKLDELRAVLAVADEEWRSMILFGLYTGQRLADIANLAWPNLDMERGEIRLTTQKTGRRQVLPLPEPLRQHISTLTAGDDPKAPLHPRAVATMGRQHGRSGAISKEFGEILAAAGLRGGGQREKGSARMKHELSFHSLRHTATSLLKEAGIPDAVVMSYIGHDSPEVSQGYTHTGREALEQAAAAFPQL